MGPCASDNKLSSRVSLYAYIIVGCDSSDVISGSGVMGGVVFVTMMRSRREMKESSDSNPQRRPDISARVHDG